MKKIILVFTLILGIASYGQELYIDVGRNASSFEFQNSQGVMLENLQATTKSFVGLGYKHRLFTEDLSITIGATYNSYGAIGSDITLNNSFEWDADYLGFQLGLEYNLFQIQNLSFYLRASTAAEFIIQGNQRVNNQVQNLVGLEEFDNTAIFFRFGGGLAYPVSESTKIRVHYQYGKSLALKDDSAGSNEELKIRSHQIGIGFVIDLTPKQDDDDTNQDIDND